MSKSQVGLEILITAPGGVPPAIPATAEAVRQMNDELRKTQSIEVTRLGKFSGLPQEVLAATRANAMKARAQEMLAGMESGPSGGNAATSRGAGPSFTVMLDSLDKAGPKIERAVHSISLLKIASETEGFQAALEKLGPTYRSLFNDLTTGLTAVVFAAQGARDLAVLTKGMSTGAMWTTGAAGLGLAGVAMVKASADAAVEMSTAQVDKAASSNRLFDVANARAKDVQTVDQLNKLIESIQYDAKMFFTSGQFEQGTQMSALAQSLLASRDAVLARNALTQAERVAAQEAKFRDEQIKSTAESWGEAQAALDEATAAAKREALSRQPLSVQIDAAKEALRKEEAKAARSLENWRKELDKSTLDAQTKEDSLAAKKASLQVPVVQSQAALAELQARDGIKTGSKADFIASVRAQIMGLEWQAPKADSGRRFTLPVDSAIRQGLIVGNVRANTDVSSGQTLVGLQREANGHLKRIAEKKEPLPGVPAGP